MSTIDYVIVFAYIAGILSYVIYRANKNDNSISGFLVNNKTTRLLTLIFSIVATNVGAGFFLSVSSAAYDTGISFGISMSIVSVVTCLTLALLAGRIKRLADEHGAGSVSELLSKQYRSNAVGVTAAVVTIGGYIFISALQFVGIGAVGSAISGISLEDLLLVAGITTIAYTSISGIKSNFQADFVSFLIMSITMPLAIYFVISSGRLDFSAIPASHLDIFAFSGVSFFVASFILSIVSAFMFMELWQRIFAAETPGTARKAFLVSALIQPAFIGAGIFFGISAKLTFPDINSNTAIFRVMGEFLPSGVLGLTLVAVLAVLMSTVNSLVLVGGSAFFTSILKPMMNRANSDPGIRMVQLSTAAFGGVALLFAFALPDLVRLLLMGAFILLPLCPAIIWSLYADKPHATPAIMSILTGVITTLAFVPTMPDTAFAPGFLVALFVMFAGQFYFNKVKSS